MNISMRDLRILGLSVVMLFLLSYTVYSSSREDLSGKALPPIIFVKQVPVDHTGGTIADIFTNIQGANPAADQPIGGGLFRLDPDGTLTDLTPYDHVAVRDPEISYDGTHVMFAMKRGARAKWKIYEMTVDGQDLRVLRANDDANYWDPAYLPDGGILFLSDRLELIARANDNIPENKLPEGQLFVMDADGNNIQTINANPHGTFNPQLSQSGQIVFTQWDLVDLRENASLPPDGMSYSRFLIWEAYIDGSREGHPIFGAHLVQDFAGGFTEMRELPDGDMIATFTKPEFSYGAGSIVRFTPRGMQDEQSYTWLTSEEHYTREASNTAGRYRSPYASLDGRIIASYAPGMVWDDGSGDVPDFDLVLLDETGEHTVLYSDPDFWDWQAVFVEPKEAPQIAEPLTIEGYERYGIINTYDVTVRNRNVDHVVNGDAQPDTGLDEAVAVRVFELGRPIAPYAGGSGDQELQFRYVGEAPVWEDGSFAAVVSARTLILWELIDEDGNVLVRERALSELAPGEVRSCGGCHTPDNFEGRVSNMALQNPTNLTMLDVDRDDDGIVDLIADYLGGSEQIVTGKP